MKIDLYQIDAFTDTLFSGNPAAVCPLEEFLSDEKMQSIATENNLSETAFFVKRNGEYAIRWFTPEKEVKLCGHATLATSYVIFNYLGNQLNAITFDSKSGPLHVKKLNDGKIQLNFPAIDCERVTMNNIFGDALGIQPDAVFQSKQDFLVIFENQSQIESIIPDNNALINLGLRGVIISSLANATEIDFVSRFFAPGCGVPEDPVTGSAHCILTPYWSKVLGKSCLKAKQLSKRGGELLCELKGERVYLTGSAVPYMKAEIVIE